MLKILKVILLLLLFVAVCGVTCNSSFAENKLFTLTPGTKNINLYNFYEEKTFPSEQSLLLTFKRDGLNSKPNKIFNTSENNFSSRDLTKEPYLLTNNHFVNNKIKAAYLFKPGLTGNCSRILKMEIKKTTSLYDEITLDDEDLLGNSIGDLNNYLITRNPGNRIQPLIFKEKQVSPFANRVKTVYFLTALSTMIGQSGQIQDAFTKGKCLTGGGTSKSDQYGYNNVVRNLMNPFGRAVKGAKVDDSGPIVNYIQHPLFGFGVASYLTASGASTPEVFLVSLADNFLFEFVAEGTYVAPSGIDFLSTTGGCVLGYFATKYIFKKPFSAFLNKTSMLKSKYHVTFYPIIEPGYAGNGMKIGSQITFKH